MRVPLLPLMLLLACNPAPDAVERVSIGDHDVWLDRGGLAIARGDGSVLLESRLDGDGGALPGLVGWREAKAEIKMLFAMFLFDEQAPAWSRAGGLELRSISSDRVDLVADDARCTIETAGDGMLRVTWTLETGAANRLAQGFVCGADDHFYGLGALVHGTDHRGEVIPTWISEQGIGKLRRTNPYDGYPVQGDVHDTYLSVPFVLSSRGFGLLLEDTRRSLFHLCTSKQPDRWAVETWNDRLQYLIIDGPTLPRVLERLTAVTGRPRELSPWALGPWIDAVHGQSAVLDVADRLRGAGVPASAIWTEDWIGGEQKLGGYHLKYQWQADPAQYPDLKGLAATLHGKGFRFLGYFNPFLEEGRPQWKEALQRGYTIEDAQGRPLAMDGPLMDQVSLPDLSRPEVASWVKGYLEGAVSLGFDGWMADYGEWLPPDARLGDGTDGMASHNRYPLEWQRVNRQVWDDRRPDGDYVFFVRSGWAGTGGLAPVVWAGDQQTEFGGLDGLASVIPLMVNGGMSGIPVMTHDVGGYSTVGPGVSPTTEELFLAWAALGAFSPIMRTHHGALADKNWHWDSSPATTAAFRDLAAIHTALYPYRRALNRQAAERGLPMVRHLALGYPTDPAVAAIADQYLLGPYLLVAPQVTAGASARKVYLPKQRGGWYGYYPDHARFAGGQTHTVQTTFAVFAPAGAVVPRLLTRVDTLDRSTDPSVKDLDDAEAGGLGIDVFLGADGGLILADGTRLTLVQSGATTTLTSVRVDGKPRTVDVANRRATVTVEATDGFELGGEGFSLEVSGAPRKRKFEVTLYW